MKYHVIACAFLLTAAHMLTLCAANATFVVAAANRGALTPGSEIFQLVFPNQPTLYTKLPKTVAGFVSQAVIGCMDLLYANSRDSATDTVTTVDMGKNTTSVATNLQSNTIFLAFDPKSARLFSISFDCKYTISSLDATSGEETTISTFTTSTTSGVTAFYSNGTSNLLTLLWSQTSSGSADAHSADSDRHSDADSGDSDDDSDDSSADSDFWRRHDLEMGYAGDGTVHDDPSRRSSDLRRHPAHSRVHSGDGSDHSGDSDEHSGHSSASKSYTLYQTDVSSGAQSSSSIDTGGVIVQWTTFDVKSQMWVGFGAGASGNVLMWMHASDTKFTTVSITGLSSPLTCNPNTCVAALEPATQLLYIWTDDQHAVLEVQVSIGKVLQQMAVKQFGGTRRAVSMDLAFWLCT